MSLEDETESLGEDVRDLAVVMEDLDTSVKALTKVLDLLAEFSKPSELPKEGKPQ